MNCYSCEHVDADFSVEPCKTCDNGSHYKSAASTGQWLFTSWHTWVCSECGKNPTAGMGYVPGAEFMTENFKYCNHCGKRMEVKG